MTKEQALKLVDGLEKKVEQLNDVRRELELSKNREEFERKQRQEAEAKLEAQTKELEAYKEIKDAFGKLLNLFRVSHDVLEGAHPEGTEVTLTKTLRKIKVEKAPVKLVKISDDKIPGRILRVVSEGGAAGKEWEPNEITDKISKKWGLTSNSVVAMEVKKLVDSGVLAKAPGRDKTHFTYFVPEGVELE